MTETPTDRDLHRIFCLLRPLTNDLVQNNAGRGFRAVQVFEALSGNYLYRASANLTVCFRVVALDHKTRERV